MHSRNAWLLVLMTLGACGCQSYYPYGYAGTGPYPTAPAGGFVPPQGAYAPAQGTYAVPQGASMAPPMTYSPTPAVPRTYQPAPGGVVSGQVGTPTPAGARGYQPVPAPTQSRGAAVPTTPISQPGGTVEAPVPKPVEPRTIPDSVGDSLRSDDADEIKGASREANPATTSPRRSSDALTDETADEIETTDYDGFAPPRSPIRRTSGTAESTRRLKKSPYSHDPGYRKLSGIVTQDPQTLEWQLKYNPREDDDYGGTLTLSGDEMLENLVEGDAVVVHGKIDPRDTDRFGHPRYKPDPNRLKILIDPDSDGR